MFHHKLLRRLLALICALALCLGLSGPVSAAGDVYFSVVNDSMITLSDSTMPVWSGGVLYVPHSVFDGTNSTGIGFGLNFSYNRDTGIASLFTTQQILTFDLNRGISYDYISGTPLKGRAILRNGRPYLPVGQVCSFFGLSYSVIAIPEGHIVRVKNSAVSLSDAAFVDAASNLISRYLREYSQSQQSPPTPAPGPTHRFRRSPRTPVIRWSILASAVTTPRDWPRCWTLWTQTTKQACFSSLLMGWSGRMTCSTAS